MSRPRMIAREEFLDMNTEAYKIGSFYNALVVRTNYDGREVIGILTNYHIKQKSQEE
jgi:hypothetical protein